MPVGTVEKQTRETPALTPGAGGNRRDVSHAPVFLMKCSQGMTICMTEINQVALHKYSLYPSF
jgi:hypothetical protein